MTAAGTAKLDPDQFAVGAVGLALIVLLLACIAVSLWRRS